MTNNVIDEAAEKEIVSTKEVNALIRYASGAGEGWEVSIRPRRIFSGCP